MTMILAHLQRLPGCHFWRANTGAAKFKDRTVRFGERGQADILGVAKGRFVAVEIKTETGRIRPDQDAWGHLITQAGGMYILARCLDDALGPVQELLK
jgi:hypothetical protein